MHVNFFATSDPYVQSFTHQQSSIVHSHYADFVKFETCICQAHIAEVNKISSIETILIVSESRMRKMAHHQHIIVFADGDTEKENKQ